MNAKVIPIRPEPQSLHWTIDPVEFARQHAINQLRAETTDGVEANPGRELDAIRQEEE